MSRQCDASLGLCRRGQWRPVPIIAPCMRILKEKESLVNTIDRLDSECFAVRKRIEREMEAIRNELDMKVKKRSRPLSSLEIPPRHPPGYAEGFRPTVTPSRIKRDEISEDSTKSSSNLDQKNAELASRKRMIPTDMSWHLDRIMGWYHYNKEERNME